MDTQWTLDGQASYFETARSIGEVLGQLVGRGVYSVELIEEVFPRFGFTYDRSTDVLCYKERRVEVGSLDAPTMAANIAASNGGELANGMSPDARLTDAVAISEAVFRLLFPGRTPWGRQYADRDRAFAANCAAIRSGQGAHTWLH